ncbi:hypothetical protein [Salinispora arenicola]|uniref:Uncharacterized protein n=2 Tax=Salinispora arenicola TaxID=168697 RepID=A0A542XSU7_SALAC|nr:hypothetical protein [Salinispora arenicola]MCN0151219.1 hypothetical protein [Salinispora arenicola]MCN0176754.1 hypothetical protein [Salinispora arenicola]NIL41262.1 hypothetical protein [Salinispora arenicola]NIL58984.1 hypothetical protein [Salinispora arenicola]NIL64492.1 hypothetical protein [Salinispora arenicola]
MRVVLWVIGIVAGLLILLGLLLEAARWLMVIGAIALVVVVIMAVVKVRQLSRDSQRRH